MTPATSSETRFDRTSGMTLLLCVLFMAGASVTVMASYAQPTDGWYYESRLDGRWVARAPLTQGPSPLQPGDVVLEIAGSAVPQMATRPLPPPAGWVPGATAHYVVEREGVSRSLDVPLSTRSLAAAARVYQLNGGFSAFVNLLWLAIGFGVFLIRPRNTAARLLLLFTVYWASVNLILQLDNSVTTYYYEPFVFWGTFLLNSLWLCMYAVILHFVLAFPVCKWPLARHPRLTLFLIYGYALLGTMAAVILGLFDLVGLLLGLMFVVLVVTMLVVTIHNLRHVWGTVERAQVGWVALGVCAPVVGVAAGLPLQILIPSLGQSVLNLVWTGLAALLPVCLGVAITRFRLFDIYVIVRRTLVYTVLTITLGLVYLGVVTLLQNLFAALTGQSSPAALVISTLLIAALFNPLRQRIQDFIDRRFYRHKYNVEQALARFAAVARSETDMEKLTDSMLGTLQSTLQPAAMSVWLKTTRERQGRNQGVATHDPL